jgi:hypothetical protein
MANMRGMIVIASGLVAATFQMASAHAMPGENDGHWVADAKLYAQPGWSQADLIGQGVDICDQLMSHGEGTKPAPYDAVVHGVEGTFANVPDRAHAVLVINTAIVTLCPSEGPITPVG